MPQQGFGKVWQPSWLVEDRYGGYNKAPGAIPYGYSHLRREVHDLAQAFPDEAEVTAFVSPVAPQLALAMELRIQPIAVLAFSRHAVALKARIMASMEAPAQHLGSGRLQDLFRTPAERLSHGVDDRRVPAEHYRAERDLRPTVIARKVRFGSPSNAGAPTRGVLVSGLHSLKKRPVDGVSHLQAVLDPLALDFHQDPFPRLFPAAPT